MDRSVAKNVMKYLYSVMQIKYIKCTGPSSEPAYIYLICKTIARLMQLDVTSCLLMEEKLIHRNVKRRIFILKIFY